ncbi:MAG: SiaB family protein kinase [Flavobacteriales bacterium]|nr:SiaB family protein kinase [Flavobacteriales bacterium]
MSNIVTIIGEFRAIFDRDRICMYYHGDFDDRFTDKLISIANYDVAKKTKRRMAFLISESFQNIIRHGDNELGNKHSGLFGVRGVDPFLHIFSSNVITRESYIYLDESISNLNRLDDDELKEHYRTVLNEGKLTDKGGAGLGLIEMAKKSRRPIQTQFIDLNDELYAFNLQIDLIVDEEAPAEQLANPMVINDNRKLYDLITGHNILFVYKGEFSQDLIGPMIKLLENNGNTENSSMGFKIYTMAIEMMQNVSSHAAASFGRQNGLFLISHTDSGYYLCTGNYIEGDGKEILAKADELNQLSKDELDMMYQETIETSETSSPSLGLIDMRRTLMNTIDIKVEHDSIGTYLIMGIEITPQNNS